MAAARLVRVGLATMTGALSLLLLAACPARPARHLAWRVPRHGRRVPWPPMPRWIVRARSLTGCRSGQRGGRGPRPHPPPPRSSRRGWCGWTGCAASRWRRWRCRPWSGIGPPPLLVDDDRGRGRQPFGDVDVWPGQRRHEALPEGAVRLVDHPLRLRRDRVEHQRALARAGGAGEDRQT